MSEQGKENAVQHLGGAPCRADEFMRWNRSMLVHERAYLSKVMATQAGFLSDEDRAAILHDLQDIDWLIAQNDAEGLTDEECAVVKRKFHAEQEGLVLPDFEMWPVSEGPVRPSQRDTS